MKKILFFMILVLSFYSCSQSFDNLDEYIPEKSISSIPNNILRDWSGKIEVIIVSNEIKSNNSKENHNAVSVKVPSDYVVVSGGAHLFDVAEKGALLVSSYPNSDLSGWIANSKDHIQLAPHGLKVYAIGLKIVGMSRSELLKYITVVTAQTYGGNASGDIVVSATLPKDYTLIGGGAKIDNVRGKGVMLKGSMQKYLPRSSTQPTKWDMYPTNAWEAVARDHIANSSGTLTSYAIGIKNILPIVGAVNIQSFYKIYESKVYNPYFMMGMGADFNTVMTSGGAKVYSTYNRGRFFISLIPDLNSFTAGAKDHLRADNAMSGLISIITISKKR